MFMTQKTMCSDKKYLHNLYICADQMYLLSILRQESPVCCIQIDKKNLHLYIQGVPKKMLILSGFEFLTSGGVFLRVKNNSKDFLFYKTFWVL